MRFLFRTLPAGYALAPKILVEQKLAVGYLYRETPDDPSDSGWRFFSGTETDDYVNDPDHIGLYDLKTILKIDPSVRPCLNAPAGSAFERSEDGRSFLPVTMDCPD